MIYGLYVVTYIILGTFATIQTEAREITDFLKICHRNEPDLNKCAATAVESLRPFLLTGIPELDVPAIEPLDIGELVLFEKDQNGFKLSVNDVVVYGAGNFILNKLVAKNDGRRIDIEILLPKFHIKGMYDVNGQFLTFPIKGNGPFNGNFTNFSGIVKVLNENKIIDGKERFTIKALNIHVKVGKGRLHLQNLFGGDKTIGDVINDALNQNFETLGQIIMPLIEKAIAKKFKDVGNKFLKQFTADQLFPN